MPALQKTIPSGTREETASGPSDTPPEDRDRVLIQKIVTAWDAAEDELLQLTTEVEDWLGSREADSSLQLRKTREALASYHQLKTRNEQDRTRIKQLKKTLRHKDESTLYKKDKHKAMETSLLTQVRDLESRLESSQLELTALKDELFKLNHSPIGKGKGKMRENPLPLPPQPIPSPRLPPFIREARDRDDSESGSSSDDVVPFIPPLPFQDEPTTPMASIASVDSWNNAVRRMKLTRATAENNASTSSVHPVLARVSEEADVADLVEPGKRNGIVKGASPNHRVSYIDTASVPPTMAPTNPYIPAIHDRKYKDRERYEHATEFLDGYGRAFSQGFELAAKLGVGPHQPSRIAQSSSLPYYYYPSSNPNTPYYYPSPQTEEQPSYTPSHSPRPQATYRNFETQHDGAGTLNVQLEHSHFFGDIHGSVNSHNTVNTYSHSKLYSMTTFGSSATMIVVDTYYHKRTLAQMEKNHLSTLARYENYHRTVEYTGLLTLLVLGLRFLLGRRLQ